MTRVVVQLSVARRAYSSTEPWLQSHNTGSMLGVSIGDRRILTLAAGLENTSLVRVQKGGRGMWCEARIIATDIHAGLGLVTVDDDAFWNDMQSIAIAPKVPTDGEVALHRWDDGQFKTGSGDVKDVTVAPARLSRCNT